MKVLGQNSTPVSPPPKLVYRNTEQWLSKNIFQEYCVGEDLNTRFLPPSRMIRGTNVINESKMSSMWDMSFFKQKGLQCRLRV